MAEEFKDRYRRLFVDEAWNKGNVDVLDEIYAPDFVQHRPPYPDIVGLEALKKHILGVRVVYPDWHLSIDENIMDGNSGASRGSWGGTLTGQSQTTGIVAAGQKVKCAFCGFARFVNAKVVEEWSCNDYLGYMQQLGVVPKSG